jgi:flagellar hook-length control protein FliK
MPGEFSFEPANTDTVKHVNAANTSTDASVLGIAKLDVQAPQHAQALTSPQPAPSPERVFAADNHANIVSNVRTNLLPNGGSMQITLNPPELGAIQVAVQMRDGVMNASFETTSDQATRLLSHSLGELRTSLENSGIAVDKLHVEQSPKNQQSQNHANDGDRQQQQSQSQDSSARREQERRELLQRMWRRLSEGSDPLDMVA